MAYTYPDETTTPYRSIAYISVTWSDGSHTFGSGAFVGRNDVLTAAHVVYNPYATATDINVYPAYDQGAGPYGSFTTGQWTENHYSIAITTDDMIYEKDTSWDLALIGLSQPLGDTVGWLGISPSAGSNTYEIVGYPGTQNGHLTSDSGYASVDSYNNFGITGIYHAPGSSGGPLLNANDDIVGVVSTSSWANRIDGEWDTLQGWMSANDSLIGGITTPAVPAAPTSGDDRITLTAGNDTVSALGGGDTVSGLAGDDVLYGNQGRDSLLGGDGNDTLYGGQDEDTITGGAGNDLLYGNLGNDTLSAEAGTDTLYGGQGDDLIFGGDGNDTLYGNLGNDTLYGDGITFGGDPGDDVIHGGPGTDTAVYLYSRDTYTLTHNADGSISVSGHDRLYDVEYIRFADQTLWIGT